jgi:hypothetical protein
MKQIFALILAVLFVFCVAGAAVATQPNNPGPGYYQKIHGENAGEIKYFPNGHPQPQDNNEWVYLGNTPPSCGGNWQFNLNLDNFALKMDFDGAWVLGGYTFGKGFGIGDSSLWAAGAGKGGIGSAFGTGGAWAGANADSWVKYDWKGPIYGVSLGTDSLAFAGVENTLALGLVGKGLVIGGFEGYAKECTLDYSELNLPGFLYDSHGDTSALAWQSAEGGYEGGAMLVNFWSCGRPENASIAASIDLFGASSVESGRFGGWLEPGVYVEGLWSAGAVTTQVTTSFDRDGFACVNGGWNAAGGLVLVANQGLCDPASANASINASYNGSGPLGTNYVGSAFGGVQTQIVQYQYGVGSYSAANVTVQSSITGGSPR